MTSIVRQLELNPLHLLATDIDEIYVIANYASHGLVVPSVCLAAVMIG